MQPFFDQRPGYLQIKTFWKVKVCVCVGVLQYSTYDTFSEFSSSFVYHGIGCGTSSDVTITEESSGGESKPYPSKRQDTRTISR